MLTLECLTHARSMAQVEDAISQSGSPRLGKGTWGEVYVIPGTNLVLKLSGDWGYHLFVEHVLAHPSRLFPRIYNHWEIDGRWATVMERLEDWAYERGDRQYRGRKQFSRLVWGKNLSAEEEETLKSLNAARIRNRCGDDLFEQNTMLRPATGELVITDPWWRPTQADEYHPHIDGDLSSSSWSSSGTSTSPLFSS